MNSSEMTDILDIAGNIHSPWPDRFFILLIVVVALAAFVLFRVFYKLWQKRKKKGLATLSPLERATQGLKALQSATDQKPDQLYWQLTEIFKRYVTDALNCDLDDKTREEIRRLARDFARYCRDEKQWRDILALLDRSEQIKFARETAQAGEMAQDVRLVADFVGYSSQKMAEEMRAKPI